MKKDYKRVLTRHCQLKLSVLKRPKGETLSLKKENKTFLSAPQKSTKQISTIASETFAKSLF